MGPADLAAVSMAGANPIDWSTLTFTSTESYTTCFTGQSGCGLFPSYPFGTNDTPCTDSLSGPGTSGGEGILTFSGSGNQAGQTYTTTLTHNNAGIVTLTITNPTSGSPTLRNQYTIKAEVQVADTAGILSNIATIYLGNYVFL